MMFNNHRAFIIFPLFPWLKTGIFILLRRLSAKPLHAKEHGLDKLMKRGFSRFIFAVNYINPRRKPKAFLTEAAKMTDI